MKFCTARLPSYPIFIGPQYVNLLIFFFKIWDKDSKTDEKDKILKKQDLQRDLFPIQNLLVVSQILSNFAEIYQHIIYSSGVKQDIIQEEGNLAICRLDNSRVISGSCHLWLVQYLWGKLYVWRD